MPRLAIRISAMASPKTSQASGRAAPRGTGADATVKHKRANRVLPIGVWTVPEALAANDGWTAVSGVKFYTPIVW